MFNEAVQNVCAYQRTRLLAISPLPARLGKSEDTICLITGGTSLFELLIELLFSHTLSLTYALGTLCLEIPGCYADRSKSLSGTLVLVS